MEPQNELLSEFDPLEEEKRVTRVDGPLGKIRYELHGPEEGELVVLCHGVSWWSFCFEPLSKFLASNGFRVLTFDFYGRGFSDAPSATYNENLFVQQIHSLLDTLGFKDTFNLVGYSMGGWVASHFTKVYPQRVKKLVLLGPAVVPVEIPFVGKIATAPFIGWTMMKLMGKSVTLATLRSNRFQQDFHHYGRFEKLIENLIKRTEWQIVNKVGYLDAFHSTICNMPLSTGILDIMEEIGKQDIPLYLIWGTQDITAPFSRHKLILERVPKAKVVGLEEVAHALVFEAPDQVHNAVFDALQGK